MPTVKQDEGHALFEPQVPRRTSIGHLAPRVIVLWVLLDIGLRFLPINWFDIGPFYDALRFAPRYSPFAPGVRYCSSGIPGEAARMANIEAAEYIDLCFTTDELGFRLTPTAGEPASPRVLVLGGDSFTYGAGLSDGETFPAALAKHSRLETFNAGRFHLDPEGLPEIDWLLSRLKRRPDIAVYVYLEHFNLTCAGGRAGFVGWVDANYPEVGGWLRYGRKLGTAWWQVSPLEILSQRAFKSVNNDRILPNPYKDSVHRLRLPDGSSLLVREYEMRNALLHRDQKQVRDTAACLEWWQDSLADRGIEAYILLMPSRYTIYGPLLESGEALERVRGAEEYILQLEAALRDRNVRTVNALSIFKPIAKAELETGQLSFYREDNHWNPRGVNTVARAVAETLNSNRELTAYNPRRSDRPGTGDE